MNLPIGIEYAVMEAETATALPHGPEWHYEPKWDGFRCLAFRDGDEVELRSKAGQPLARYFPEVTAMLQECDTPQFVLDGELAVLADGQLDFDLLLQRIHPAASRIQKLSVATPAHFMVFDLLVDAQGHRIDQLPLRARREALEHFARHHFRNRGGYT